MYGISSSSKESIALAIDKMFDTLAYNFLGNMPKLRNKSPFWGSSPPFSLANIFVQAIGNKEPNFLERDVIRSLLVSSFGYIEGLKNRTSANVVETIDALAKEARIGGHGISTNQVVEIMAREMEKAKGQLKLIAEAETTKTRNMGSLMNIADTSNKQGVEDPTCFFVVVRDNSLCKECLRLHMLPDGNTPRVWKMSEFSMGWHKRGEDRPSACGEHPHCRCTLVRLGEGWGFKDGYIAFVSLTHDEYARQRGEE